MKTVTSILAMVLLFGWSAMAQTHFVELTMSKGTNQTGFIRQVVADKAQAIEFMAKYVSAYGKDQTIFAQLHTCNHDRGGPCTVEILEGKEPTSVTPIDAKTVVEVDLKTAYNRATTDNKVGFKVPATTETKTAVAEKIVAEEFIGKEVIVIKQDDPKAIEPTK